MEAFLLLCWLAKIIRAQCHLYHTVKLLLLSVPGRHRPPSGASQEPRGLLQLCRTRVLCGGPDLADLARGCSLQGKKELLTAPRDEFASPNMSQVGAAAVRRGNESLRRAGWQDLVSSNRRAAVQELVLSAGREMPFCLCSHCGKHASLFPFVGGS